MSLGWPSIASLVLTGILRQKEQEVHREEHLPSSSSLTVSLYCPQPAEPHRDPADNGELRLVDSQPQNHRAEDARVGLLLENNNWVTGYSFGNSASTGTFFSTQELPCGLPHTATTFRLRPDKMQLRLHKWRCFQPHDVSMSQQPSKSE